MSQEKSKAASLLQALNARFLANEPARFRTMPDAVDNEKVKAYAAAAFSLYNAGSLVLRRGYNLLSVTPPDFNPWSDEVFYDGQKLPETISDDLVAAGELLLPYLDELTARAQAYYAKIDPQNQPDGGDVDVEKLAPLVTSPEEFDRLLNEATERYEDLSLRRRVMEQRLERLKDRTEVAVAQARVLSGSAIDLVVGTGEDVSAATGGSLMSEESLARLKEDVRKQAEEHQSEMDKQLAGLPEEVRDAFKGMYNEDAMIDMVTEMSAEAADVGSQGSREGFLVASKDEGELALKVLDAVNALLFDVDPPIKCGPCLIGKDALKPDAVEDAATDK